MIKDRLIGLAHIGIPVRSIETSKAFYKELGFEIADEKPSLDGFSVIMLIFGNLIIELYQKLDDSEPEVQNRCDGHIDHIAIEVSDIERTYQDVLDHNFELVTNGIIKIDVWENGSKYFIIVGPDRERIEFSQRC